MVSGQSSVVSGEMVGIGTTLPHPP